MKSKALFIDRDGVINETIHRYNKDYKKKIDDSPFNIKELKLRMVTEYLLVHL